MPVRPLEEIALAFTYGAQKYEPDNYRRGTNWRRYLGAALRHTFAFARGEDADPETGLSHLAHTAACLMILRELQLDGLGADDRIKAAAPVARWLGTTGGRMSDTNPPQAELPEFLTVDEAAILLRIRATGSAPRCCNSSA